ncbi:MAG: hypothetical protein M1820_003690 [Bogoriella megaspora]|nr:MAG: hypothetical protein M1820_003690 [Bogoriella megaspora]
MVLGIPNLCSKCARTWSFQNVLVQPRSGRAVIPKLQRNAPTSFFLHIQRNSIHSSRRVLRRSQFEPLRPPAPDSLPKPRPPKTYTRTRKWFRRLFYASLISGGVYVLDTRFYDAVLTRSFRTFAFGLVAALDYKINFRAHPPLAKSIAHVHARNAQMLCDLLAMNGGLYLKIGQAIAMQSAVLPPEFQKMFAKMFDDAPQNTWEDVRKVIEEDFGKSVEEVFGVGFDIRESKKGVMERTARASASVAQVHWAKLADGREIAIKVQKREIARQVGWDLWAFKVVARIYTWWFDLPMYSLVPYITERLLLETDFQNEASNSEKMSEYISREPRLRGRVHIPKVYHDLSSKRVMTAEWIEGVRLWDKDGITKPWYGGWRRGSPGCRGTPLDSPSSQLNILPASDPNKEQLKPTRTQWKGSRGDGGLGLSLSTVMQTMTDLFSAQMFLWGFVHCDPHPGNILIRRQPSGRAELVLLDHGLYISMSQSFRLQYARFWKSLMIFDNNAIGEIAKQWGIAAPDIFASATLMRPYEGGDGSTKEGLGKELKGKEAQERAYEMQMRMRSGIRKLLAEEENFPRELLFLGRNLRIVQGNNQFLGSPVNRIKITGTWASRALAESRKQTWSQEFKGWWDHMKFKTVMLASDVFFWWAKLKQLAGQGMGMEDELEGKMKDMAKDFGVELNHGVFEG